MKIDAIIALINHPNPSPPDDVLRAAAFEALDMVTTAVDSLKRIADASDGGRPSVADEMRQMGLPECLTTMRRALILRYGSRIEEPDGSPESVAFDALGRMVD